MLYGGLAIALATLRALVFAPGPDAPAVMEGRAARSFSTGDLVAAFGQCRQAIGFWADGIRQRDVEDAVWLSPIAYSRWLGALSWREGWTADQFIGHWVLAREASMGRLTFVVRLMAFPHVAVLDPDEEPAKPDPAEITNVRFALRWRSRDGVWRQTPLEGKLVSQWRDREWRGAAGVPWFVALPDLGPRLEPSLRPVDIGLGDYYGAAWWVSGQIPRDLAAFGHFEVRVISRRKVRVATFPIPVPPMPRQRG